jgi:hypothetical protein
MVKFLDRLASVATFAAILCLALAVLAVPTTGLRADEGSGTGDPTQQGCPCGNPPADHDSPAYSEWSDCAAEYGGEDGGACSFFSCLTSTSGCTDRSCLGPWHCVFRYSTSSCDCI